MGFIAHVKLLRYLLLYVQFSLFHSNLLTDSSDVREFRGRDREADTTPTIQITIIKIRRNAFAIIPQA